jgi:hypothetical protein
MILINCTTISLVSLVSKKREIKYKSIGKLTKLIGLVVEAYLNKLQNLAIKLLVTVILQSIHSQPIAAFKKDAHKHKGYITQTDLCTFKFLKCK